MIDEQEPFEPDLDGARQQPADKHAYRVDGKNSAAWAMEKLRKYTAQIGDNNEVMVDRVKAITEWRDTENAKLQRHVDYFTGLLRTWHMSQFQADPKANKSISLPDGVLKHRIGAEIVEITDTDEFFAYAETDKELIRVETEPDKKAIKERCKEGEVIPGVTFRRQDDVFAVEPKEEPSL